MSCDTCPVPPTVDLDLLAPLPDAHLERLLGAAVISREPVHRWPLSCVERLSLADGRRLAYKAQLQPSHELAFYAAARSPLLPHVQVLADGPCSHLVLPWLSDPTPDPADPEVLARTIDDVSRRIAGIGGASLPHYLDLGSPTGVHAAIDDTLEHAVQLADRAFLPRLDRAMVAHVRSALSRDDLVHALTRNAVFTNGDLKAAQVFLAADGGVTVIDWQRPLRAAFGLDVVGALLEAGHDPMPYTDRPANVAFWLQRLHWAITAQHDLFPAEPWPVFDAWSSEALDHLVSLL